MVPSKTVPRPVGAERGGGCLVVETYSSGATDGVRFEGPGAPAPVDFPRIVLQQILSYAGEGLRQLSRGGMEVGGVLFGRRTGAGIQVHAWRPIDCSHTRGPAFLLSNDDFQALANHLAAAETDPALQVLEPVGWFVSHTRKGLVLADEDRRLFDQFFSGAYRIGLVLHARKGHATEAALFLRDSAAQLNEEPVLRTLAASEFPAVELPLFDSLAPTNLEMTVPPRPRQAGGSVTNTRLAGTAPANAAAAFWRKVPGWGYASLGVLLCGALVLAIPMRRPAPGGDGLEALRLRLQDAKGQLRIEWDRDSATIRNAQNATLYITDGRPLAPVSLDRDTAQKGYINYGRLSEDITVRLVVNRGADSPIQELARFVGAPVPKEVPKELVETRARRDQLLEEIRNLRLQIRQEVERSQNLESTVARIERQLERSRN